MFWSTLSSKEAIELGFFPSSIGRISGVLKQLESFKRRCYYKYNMAFIIEWLGAVFDPWSILRFSFTKYTCLCHSSTLAWKIPWTEEPGGLQTMGLLRVGHDWATSLSLFTFMHWRRKWQPTPVFLPGESQGWGSLVGCRPLGRTESDTTEAT